MPATIAITSLTRSDLITLVANHIGGAAADARGAALYALDQQQPGVAAQEHDRMWGAMPWSRSDWKAGRVYVLVRQDHPGHDGPAQVRCVYASHDESAARGAGKIAGGYAHLAMYRSDGDIVATGTGYAGTLIPIV